MTRPREDGPSSPACSSLFNWESSRPEVSIFLGRLSEPACGRGGAGSNSPGVGREKGLSPHRLSMSAAWLVPEHVTGRAASAAWSQSCRPGSWEALYKLCSDPPSWKSEVPEDQRVTEELGPKPGYPDAHLSAPSALSCLPQEPRWAGRYEQSPQHLGAHPCLSLRTRSSALGVKINVSRFLLERQLSSVGTWP